MRSLRIMALLLLLTPGCRAPGLFSRNDPLDDALPPSESQTSLAAGPNVPAAAGTLPASPSDPDQLQRQLAARGPGMMQTSPDPTRSSQNLQSLPVSELLARGEQAYNEQRLREARQYLEAIVHKQPAHPRAHHLLAVVSDLEGRFGDAEHHYQLALQSDSNNAAIVGDLGYSYLLQGRHDLAEQYLQQARLLDPAHVNAAQNLALLHSLRGDYSRARTTLAEILPPAQVDQKLAQLFPSGAPGTMPSNQFHPGSPYDPPSPANTAASQPGWQQPSYGPPGMTTQAMPVDPRYAAANPGYPPGVNDSDPGLINHRLAAIDRSGYPSNGAPIVVGPGSATASPAIQNPTFPSMSAGPTQPTGRSADAPYMTGAVSPHSSVQSAVGFRPEVGDFTGGDSSAATNAPHPQRRWPPSTWPPEPTSTGVQPVSGESGEPATAPASGGVTYLMPNRSAQQPAPATRQQPAAMMTTPAPSSPSPAPRTSSSLSEPVLYDTGPGNSRTVTWNGPFPQQSSTPAPLQPPNPASPQTSTDDAARRTAAAIGLNAGSHQPYPLVERTSPGTSSVSGNQFPPPQRQLPGMSLPAMLAPYNQPPVAGAGPVQPQTQQANAAQSLPYIQFEAPPAPSTPSLQSYADERARYDSQFNAQAQQTYGTSPSNFIPTPANATPAPVYEVPAYRTQSGSAAPPVNHETGTPWPGRPAQSTTSGTAGAAQANNQPAQVPNSNGIIVPPPYSTTQRSSSPAAPMQTYPPRTTTDSYQGPVIIPGGGY